MSGSKAKIEEIGDRVSSNFSDFLGRADITGEFEKITLRIMKDEEHRKRIIAIINEQVGSVDFMKKVREYAGMKIDSRLFKSFKYWTIIVLSTIVTSIISIILIKLFSK